MYYSQSLQDYYSNKFGQNDEYHLLHTGAKEWFSIFPRSSRSGKTIGKRQEFYKISLLKGAGILKYEGTSYELNSSSIFLSTPRITYSWQAGSLRQEGWHCLFTDAFMQESRIDMLLRSAVFRQGRYPVFKISEEQYNEFGVLFRKMQSEISGEFPYKADLLRNYVGVAVYELLKLLSPAGLSPKYDASTQLAHSFLQLLESQFQDYRPDKPLSLSTPGDFAKKLRIHVNHLNFSLKSATGKTTNEHISERVVREAKALLKLPGWNISQIAYSLGFEYPANFNLFFKKQTGFSPTEFRNTI